MTEEIHDYTTETFFGTGWEILKRRWLQGKKLVIDFYLKPDFFKTKAEYIRKERWTKTPSAELHANGYQESTGLHDSLMWSGVRMYVKLHGSKEFPIADVFPEKKDTAYTLNDAMLSTSDREFKKGLARAQLTATADWQKLILIGMIAAGAILGTKMMGMW